MTTREECPNTRTCTCTHEDKITEDMLKYRNEKKREDGSSWMSMWPLLRTENKGIWTFIFKRGYCLEINRTSLQKSLLAQFLVSKGEKLLDRSFVVET